MKPLIKHDRTRNIIISLIAIVGALFVNACNLAPDHQSGDELTDGEKRYIDINRLIYYNSTRRWDHDNISVCFRDGSTAKRTVVKDAVVGSWNLWSNLNFQGWGDCASGSHDVEVEFMSPAELSGVCDPRVQNPSGCATVGMVANPNVYILQSRTGLDLEDTAIHEFGHVLGLDHEHQRYHATDCRNKYDAGDALELDGEITFGFYDLDSIMNYCSETQAVLSPTDIEGVRSMYGPNRLIFGEIIDLPIGADFDITVTNTVLGPPEAPPIPGTIYSIDWLNDANANNLVILALNVPPNSTELLIEPLDPDFDWKAWGRYGAEPDLNFHDFEIPHGVSSRNLYGDSIAETLYLGLRDFNGAGGNTDFRIRFLPRDEIVPPVVPDVVWRESRTIRSTTETILSSPITSLYSIAHTYPTSDMDIKITKHPTGRICTTGKASIKNVGPDNIEAIVNCNISITIAPIL